MGSLPDRRLGWIGLEEEVVTFNLWNLSGGLVGYQEYKWSKPKTRGNHPRDQKYFTYLPKETIGVYGLHLVPEGYLGVLYLVEGIWEAIAGWSEGYPCIAVLGCNPKSYKNWLNCLPNKIVPLCQPDEAGKKLASFGNAIYLGGDLDDCLIKYGRCGLPEELAGEYDYSRCISAY